MANRIIEMAKRVVSAIDQLLDGNDLIGDIDLSDEVFTDLYGEFASGSISLKDTRNVLEAIRDLRDSAIFIPVFEPSPDELRIMRSAWTRLRVRLVGYAAYIDQAKSGDASHSVSNGRTAGGMSLATPSASATCGIAGMILEKTGRVITIDGRQFHGVDPKVFKVVEFLKKAEPHPV